MTSYYPYIAAKSPIGRHSKIGSDDVEIVGLAKNSHYQNAGVLVE